ncbi:MAG: MFS transporter [Deltaproteobacteria bacterium]|nr:MFS transporter [Deltaproteobacteria bacterium]
MQSADPPEARLRSWRLRVFAGTWLSYAGYYFCRKPFYKVKGTLTVERGLSAATLGTIGSAYLVTYALGQFVAAAIGGRLGARRLLLVGMLASVLLNALAGLLPGTTALLLLMGANGLAQGTGWAGNVGTMAHWTRRSERGTIMGLWSTCYQAGGLAAGLWAAFLVGHYGWQWSFLGGAAALLLITALFGLLQRNRPEDVGLAPLEPPVGERAGPGPHDAEATEAASRGWPRSVWFTLGLMSAAYFAIKYVRYALQSWAAYFLQLNFRLSSAHAGYLADLFEAGGTAGVIVAGRLSDRRFGGRRTPVILLLLVGLALACLFLWLVGVRSVPLFALSLGLVGFLLYGPDSLLSAAGAIDVGSQAGALRASGLINGIGAVGSILQELVIGELYVRRAGHLGLIFGSLLLAASVALACMLWVAHRNRRGLSNL